MIPRRQLALAACAVLFACGGLRATPATRYQGIVLDARNLGAEELRAQSDRDPVVRDYVRRHGAPDFVLVASRMDLELVYYRDSRLVHFHRDAAGTTAVKEVVPLPTPLVNVLPVDIRAGTPGPLGVDAPLTNCWTVDLAPGHCRTCCVGPLSCATSCG